MGTALTRNNIGSFLEKAADRAALPAGMTVERLAKGALLAFQNNPSLYECSHESLISAIIEAGQLGLEPGGVMSEAYIIPYGKRAQFQIGYRGIRKLAHRNGWLIEAEVVREGDTFRYQKGLDPQLVHTPRLDIGDRPITHVYAIAWPEDGGRPLFEVMSREQVDHIKAKAKASKNGPWQTDYAEMARKTVVKRLGKNLPLDPTAERAIEYDNRADVEPVTWANVEPDTKTSAPVVPASAEDLNALLTDGNGEVDEDEDEAGADEAEHVEGASEAEAPAEDTPEDEEADEEALDRLHIRYL